MSRKIGLIGAGRMGHGMASNLLAGGFELCVVAHRSRERVEDLLTRGATEVGSPAEAAGRSDAIILCVTGSPQVEEVIFGSEGVRAAARQGQLVIDCSTGEPAVVERAAGALAEKGVDYVDAPLARTPVEAEAGTLNAMVGAAPEAFSRARPILECFCENIFFMGPVGSGTRMKLINNLITMGQASLIGEALSACRATGVDLRRFYEVISKGGGNSGIFQMIVPEILDNGSFAGMKFSLQNAAKDLGYYVRMAADADIHHEFGTQVLCVLTDALQASGPEGLVGDLVSATAMRNRLNIGKLEPVA